jgi:hypothetical protein
MVTRSAIPAANRFDMPAPLGTDFLQSAEIRDGNFIELSVECFATLAGESKRIRTPSPTFISLFLIGGTGVPLCCEEGSDDIGR